MWGVSNGDEERHDYGMANIAVCDKKATTRIDYNQVHLKKCQKCIDGRKAKDPHCFNSGTMVGPMREHIDGLD